MGQLEPLMQQNFLEYASYVIVDRAIPDIRDGCKPVQRRILHTLFQAEDGKFHKVANIIGETMKLHPHGDASIAEALVVLANKEYFIEKQGNYGSVITGHSAAASRYIECRLTPLALEGLFNKSLTTHQMSYDGRREEPIVLPAKLPVLLMIGCEGIAVGMATRVLPHNFVELLEAQIKILRQEPFVLYPDFIHGGRMDVSEYQDGKGKVTVRALIEPIGDKKVVIREIPYSTTTESLIASIENAIGKGKVKIASIQDYTTDKVEIELILSRGIYASEVIPQLYAYTDCEVSISSNIVVIQGRRPKELNVSEMIHLQTAQLKDTIRQELEYEMQQLLDKQHWLTLEQLFIENKLYKRLEQAKTNEAVRATVAAGLEPYAAHFVRPLVEADIDRLLEIRIRRISAFDIEKHAEDLDKLLQALKVCRNKLKNLTKTTIAYLEYLLQTYGKEHPRRTVIEKFEIIDPKSVARQNIKLIYDRDTGFLGSDVKHGELTFTVSEYELLLAVNKAGNYRVMTPQAKVLVGDTLHLDRFVPEQGEVFTVVYLDNKRYAYAKKVHIQRFVRNKEYSLLGSSKEGKVIFLGKGELSGKIEAQYGTGRAGKGSVELDFADVALGPVSAKGVKVAPKPITRIRVLTPQANPT